MTHPAIKESTEKSYMKAVTSAINFSQRKRMSDWEEPVPLTMTDIAQDLYDRKDVAQATKITTRSALLWFFKTKQDAESPDAATAFKILANIDIRRGRPVTQRPKGIPELDVDRILEDLARRSTRSDWASRTGAWVQAGLTTGARPIEWLDAKWSSPDKTHLQLTNAKVHLGAPAFFRLKGGVDEDRGSYDVDRLLETKDRKYRLIPVRSDLDRHKIDEHLTMLDELIPRSKTTEERATAFSNYFEECRQMLGRAVRKLWDGKKKYSFYTFRKQFSANAKAQFGSAATATLMGHSGPDTPSASHYGKASQAHPGFKSKGSDRTVWRPAQKDSKQGPTE